MVAEVAALDTRGVVRGLTDPHLRFFETWALNGTIRQQGKIRGKRGNAPFSRTVLAAIRAVPQVHVVDERALAEVDLPPRRPMQ